MGNLYNLRNMARALGVSQEWLADRADAEEVPALKAGKRWLFSAPAVVEALEVLASKPAPRGRRVAGAHPGVAAGDGRPTGDKVTSCHVAAGVPAGEVG